MYRLSFTAANMHFSESVKLAKELNTSTDLSLREMKKADFIEKGKYRTTERQTREIYKRLQTLTKKQLDLLLNENSQVQKQILFLAICKYYSFIKEFVLEVVREKALIFDYQLTDFDYNRFLSRKREVEEGIDKKSESTLSKVKQVIFTMMAQAGIINDTKERLIQPQFLDQKLIDAIVQDNTEWLRVFLMSDKEIERYG